MHFFQKHSYQIKLNQNNTFLQRNNKSLTRWFNISYARTFCSLLAFFLAPVRGARKILRNSQNIRAYYMLNHRIRCIYYYLGNSVIQRHVFIFVELLRFVGEQIGFEVLLLDLAGPDIEPGRCTFRIILVFRIFVQFLNLLILNLEIFPPFLRNSCDEIIC